MIVSKKLKLLLFVFIPFIGGCYPTDSYRKVKVVDEKEIPIEGVNRFPMQFYGIGSRVSNKEGEIWVPEDLSFFSKKGYKTLIVSPEMRRDTQYIIKK